MLNVVKNVDLLPTGTCFDDSLDFISNRLMQVRTSLIKVEALRKKLFLVHGILKKECGTLYSHAWVEEEDICWHSGVFEGDLIMAGIDKNEYYTGMEVQEYTRYSVDDALYHNLATKHYGPWLKKYQDLCRRDT